MNKEQMNQIHVVLDLETMGTKQDAAIIEIGIVIFDHTGQEGGVRLLKQHSVAIDSSTSMRYGGTVSPETLEWWMDTERTEARDNWVSSTKLPITTALNDIACLLRYYSAIEPIPLIWGNGVNFDNAILKAAYERLGVRVPWSYRQDADFRTLKLLYKDVVPEPAFIGTPHIALDDAMHEAVWLSQILRYIYGRRANKLEYELVPLEAVLNDLLSKD